MFSRKCCEAGGGAREMGPEGRLFAFRPSESGETGRKASVLVLEEGGGKVWFFFLRVGLSRWRMWCGRTVQWIRMGYVVRMRGCFFHRRG